jgi:hypothetical protein
MTEMSTDWIEGLVKPLLVKPGSTVRLTKDFDPGYLSRTRPHGRNCYGRRRNWRPRPPREPRGTRSRRNSLNGDCLASMSTARYSRRSAWYVSRLPRPEGVGAGP